MVTNLPGLVITGHCSVSKTLSGAHKCNHLYQLRLAGLSLRVLLDCFPFKVPD